MEEINETGKAISEQAPAAHQQPPDNDKESSNKSIKKWEWTPAHTLSIFSLVVSLTFGFGNCQQNRKQFVLTNRPRLQMINVGFSDPTLITLPLKVNFHIENLGNYPAEVSSGVFGWTLADPSDPAPWEHFERAKMTTLMSFSVKKERPFGQQITLDADTMLLYVIRSTLNPFFIFGEYYYRDDISEKDMVYKMVIEIQRGGAFKYIKSENSAVE